MNLENQKLYEDLKKQHTEEKGSCPVAFAITQLIKRAIEDKTYKIYYGGGYEHKTENRIKKYDVVAWFNFPGDPFFQVCLNNEEGDFCELFNANADCSLNKKLL